MKITQKSHYALHAVFELAKHIGEGPIKISRIAEAQSIPIRFLEVILNQLKRFGLLESKRGYMGGYILVRAPEKISVGEILRYMQDTQEKGDCQACQTKEKCPLNGDCTFKPMWNRAQKAMIEVYDKTTIKDLLLDEAKLKR